MDSDAIIQPANFYFSVPEEFVIKPVPVMLIVFAALLVACNSRPIPTSAVPTRTPLPPTATPVPTATPAPTATPTPVPPTLTPTVTPTRVPPVELHFWHSFSQPAALNALIDRFNAIHPDIRVIPVYAAGTDDLLDKLQTNAAPGDGSAPEMVLAYPSDIAVLAKRGTVIPLGDWLKDSQLGFMASDLKDISPAFIDRYPQLGNGIYSLGFMRSMHVMFYNIDLLQSAGFTRPPETWDEFGKVCETAGKPPDIYCYEMELDASAFATWVWGRGGELLNADGRVAVFDQKAGLDSLAWLDDSVRKKQVVLASRAFQEPADLAAGKVVFTFDTYTGLSFYDRAVKSAASQINWGIAPLPHSLKDPAADLYGPSIAVVRSSAAKQRAAFTFIKWMMDTDAGAEWVRATGYLPARQSTKVVLADFLSVNPQMGKAFDWLPYGRAEPAVAGWNSIRGLIANAMSAVAGGKATPDLALKESVKKANEILSQ
ncbi:MAG: ABC transporter substrate-binding protein [Acidobacteriota bacterium]